MTFDKELKVKGVESCSCGVGFVCKFGKILGAEIEREKFNVEVSTPSFNTYGRISLKGL